jgi:Ca2+-transporting ATPase
MSKSDCLDSLQVTEQYGLSSIEFQKRLNKYGLNKLPNPPIKSLWKLILEQFNDRLVQILLAVAMLSGILAFFENDIHAFIEPFIIITILIINSLVGIIQNKSAENSLDALKKLQPEYASVLRDGIWYNSIQSSLLVPGDIIYLRVGDKIPADCRIITLKTNTFSTDEGSLTGESATVFKTTDPVDALSSISGKLNMVRMYCRIHIHYNIYFYP